ncbi:MAG: Lrp/AsnC family transcriptional regulator [Candidatus Woesearchaeota archaeon]
MGQKRKVCGDSAGASCNAELPPRTGIGLVNIDRVKNKKLIRTNDIYCLIWVIIMKKMDSDSPNLTENDRKVLKKILDIKKIPDSDIAKSMNLSPQAVFKIREKLENCGIIKGYMPIIDFKRVGINIMAVMIIRLSSKMWKSFSDDQISERISKAPYVIDAYRVADEDASHILLLAFRDIDQKERYVSEIQTRFAEEVKIKGVYTFSVQKIISHSPLGILHEIIDKKDFSPNDLFLNHVD